MQHTKEMKVPHTNYKKLTNYFKLMYFPPHLFVPLLKILCSIRDQFKTVSYLKRSEHF